jgi:hypothetical protein
LLSLKGLLEFCERSGETTRKQKEEFSAQRTTRCNNEEFFSVFFQYSTLEDEQTWMLLHQVRCRGDLGGNSLGLVNLRWLSLSCLNLCVNTSGAQRSCSCNLQHLSAEQDTRSSQLGSDIFKSEDGNGLRGVPNNEIVTFVGAPMTYSFNDLRSGMTSYVR